MKLLLVNAININKKIETIYPPLGLGYLSSYLKKHFPSIQVKIVDRQIENAMREFHPDCIGVSSVSQNFGRATEIAKLCKSIRIPVFVGGMHISMLPEGLPKVFDFGVIGESEVTLLEVVDFLAGGGTSGSKDMEKINGLVLHNKNGVLITERRPLIQNLDSIPLPARELLNIPVGGATYLFSSRGCPYKCTFCASTRFWNKTRWFSAEYVVDELEMVIKKYRPWVIIFYDDLMVANLRRLKKIVEILASKGLHKKVKFNFSCRANLVNNKLIEILKQLDIHRICLGLESGCQKTLSLLKPGVTIEQNQSALELLCRANIPTQATFIIGSPGESEDDILKTYSFIKKSKLTDFEVYILTPFPGTLIWDMCVREGLVSTNMDWECLAVEINDNPNNKIILSEIPRNKLLELYNLFGREKIKRRITYAFHQGVTNPGWVLKKLFEMYKRHVS